MRGTLFAALLAVCPGLAWAGDLTVSDPVVPLAPPGLMAHSAYMTLTNAGDVPRTLVGVAADGYAMAHIHRSDDSGGVATMSAVDAIAIAPGQSVTFAPGGLHVMLMHPAAPQAEGDTVTLTLQFANGEALPVTATVRRLKHGS
ncbi:copper chaperone PCu(A)C [Actibacterium ureilyticum]|uniref:copper chaperone PCu(A)C n=1 Tax=Actibacterium ureilyticum TaxID=1590614 RepID=UPI000BAAC2EA|nr:copper chaperone PCu(A)C [Actibacterium ureilyticum]